VGTDTVIVEQLPPIVVDLGDDFSICEGSEAVTLDAGNPGNTYQWSNTAVSQTIEVNTEGTYSVVVTDEFGCEGTDSIVITILPAPITNGITAVYLPDNSYDFFAVATTNADTYLWDFGDGNTSNLETPNHTYANTGNYTVSLTITNNCGEDTTSVRIQAHGTGIQQITLDEHQFRV